MNLTNSDMKAIYPGTFDPITNGHLDLIKRARAIFPSLIVAVVEDNHLKNTMFSAPDRISMVKDAMNNFGLDVEVCGFSGLLIDFAKNTGANVIVRGLRAFSDFEYEFQMSAINYRLESTIHTIFLPSRDDMHFISSRMIKNVFEIGGDISSFVPANVEKKLKETNNQTPSPTKEQS
jgi:pantetheine-phosphate adenylyltransferase